MSRDTQRKHLRALSPGFERQNVPRDLSVIAGSVLAQRGDALSRHLRWDKVRVIKRWRLD